MAPHAAFPGLAIPHPIPMLLLLAALSVIVLAALLGGRVDLKRSVVIHAPPERIWAAVRHLPSLHVRHGRSIPAASAAAWSLRRGDGAAAGSVWRLEPREGGAGTPGADFEVLEADPGRTLVYRMVPGARRSGPRLARHRSTLTLEAIDEGATRLSYRLEARGRSLRVRRWVDPDRLRADLFDLRLRSIRNEVERAGAGETPSAGRAAADPPQGAARGDTAPPGPAPPAVPRPPEFTL